MPLCLSMRAWITEKAPPITSSAVSPDLSASPCSVLLGAPRSSSSARRVNARSRRAVIWAPAGGGAISRRLCPLGLLIEEAKDTYECRAHS